jgi:hypothetical protein
MLDKKRVNPERSKFIEALIQDISTIDGYDKHGITRENTGVIVTYIIHKLSAVMESDGIGEVEAILAYKFNERREFSA